MSFVQFLRIFWARRAIILLTTVTCFAAALVVIKILPARYEAKSRVLMDLVKPDPVSGQGISSGFARAYVRTQGELIRDYRVAGKVVDALGWTTSPLYTQAYAERGGGGDMRRWLAQLVIDGTDVGMIEGSNILEITYTSTSPESARVVADAIRQAYVDQTLAFKREAASRPAAWFRQQTQKLRADLTAAENRKTQFERDNGIVLQANNTDTESTRLSALAGTLPPVTVAAAPIAAPPPPPSTIQLAAVDAQIATVGKQLGPNHPDYQALLRQREVIASAVARDTAASRVTITPPSTGASIESLYTRQQAKVLGQRGKVNEAQRLGTEVTLLQDQFAKASARAAELDQQAQSSETGLTLLGSAVAPTSPVFPKVPLILFGSLALGAALGMLSVLVLELLSRRVRGAEDLRIGEVPLIGIMSREPQRRKLSLRSVPEALGIARLTHSA